MHNECSRLKRRRLATFKERSRLSIKLKWILTRGWRKQRSIVSTSSRWSWSGPTTRWSNSKMNARKSEKERSRCYLNSTKTAKESLPPTFSRLKLLDSKRRICIKHNFSTKSFERCKSKNKRIKRFSRPRKNYQIWAIALQSSSQWKWRCFKISKIP